MCLCFTRYLWRNTSYSAYQNFNSICYIFSCSFPEFSFEKHEVDLKKGKKTRQKPDQTRHSKTAVRDELGQCAQRFRKSLQISDKRRRRRSSGRQRSSGVHRQSIGELQLPIWITHFVMFTNMPYLVYSYATRELSPVPLVCLPP